MRTAEKQVKCRIISRKPGITLVDDSRDILKYRLKKRIEQRAKMISAKCPKCAIGRQEIMIEETRSQLRDYEN